MSRKMMWTTVITAVVVAALIAMVFVSGRKSATPPEEQKGTELVEMVPLPEHQRKRKLRRNGP